REDASAPLATGKTHAAVTEAVVHAAIVADVRAPIAVMEPEAAAEPAPVTRRPQRAGIRNRNPGAGHPVVVSAVPAPVAGRPHHALFRADGLYVNGQRRRRNPDFNKH